MKTIMLENSFFSLSINFWFILLITIVGLLLIFLFFIIKWVNTIDNSVEILKVKIKSFESTINSLRNEISKVNTTPVSCDQPKVINQPVVVPIIEKPIEEEKSTPIEMEIYKPLTKIEEVFFMPAPSLEGYFALSDKSNVFKETISLYKFLIDKNNPNKAEFEFHSDSIGIKNAINYPDRCLESVCNINSAHNPNTKKIITIKPGIAEKNGDNWIVNSNNKAQIKYE